MTTEYKRLPVYSPSEWLLESISSALALAVLVSIAVIFWYMDDKPLSAWRGSISLNATISILTTACTTALMHEFIRDLPDGYDTKLGTAGASLSGGQKQRLAIDRAKLRDPTVLVLGKLFIL